MGGEQLEDDKATRLFERIADEYSLILLNWAFKKLGDRAKAEDLAQEALAEIFTAVKKSVLDHRPIEKLDNLVWKIAHYVWCQTLRKNKSYRMFVPIDDLSIGDDSDFVTDLAHKEEKEKLIRSIRERLSRLNFIQREVTILYYLDGKPIKEISRKLNMSQSAVKWHLFETRKRLRKEIEIMSNTEYVYRPRKLHVAISGQTVPAPDTEMINSSLTKQNICLACYKEPKSLDELCEMLGIPKAYIESDLEWLVEKEFMKCHNGKYSTIFTIDNSRDEDEKWRIYLNHKAVLSDVIVHELIASEEKIREIGFYGCDKPMDKLLWLLINRFNSYIKTPIAPSEIPERPIRPDGGKYFPLGFDRTDLDFIEKSVDVSGWAYNGSMWSGGFWWIGLYNFGRSHIQDLIHSYTPEWKKQNDLLRRCIKGLDINSLDEDEKYTLARLIEGGFVKKEKDKILPNFYVFTAKEYRELEQRVFEPIYEKISEELLAIAEEMRAFRKGKVPPQIKEYYGLFLKMDLMDIGYITTIFAFNDGKLYVPKDKQDGEFLTFMFTGE